MIKRFLLGIKKTSSIFSIYNPISQINCRNIGRIFDFVKYNPVRFQSSTSIIQNLTQNVENLPLKDINSIIKESLYSKHQIIESNYDKILFKLINKSYEDRILSLDTLYHLLLLKPTPSFSYTECVKFVDSFRLSSDNNEQLRLLDIFYAIQFNHSDIQSHYTPQIENYVKYLKLLSPKIRLRCGIEEESNEVKEVKRILDELNVEYSSGITGHIYSPIILKGTNMVIDISCERYKHDGTNKFNPVIRLKELIMKELGWRVKFIPIDDWKYLETDEQKKNYISKFISKFYVETQFSKNPPWVTL